MSCGIGRRRGLDLVLLWLWLWPWPAATAPIGPLAWEPPHAACVALKRHTHIRKKKDKSCLLGYQLMWSWASCLPAQPVSLLASKHTTTIHLEGFF